MPVAVCSWYLSMSMCRLVVKKSSLARSLWYMDTISFFCLDRDELYLSRLMLKGKQDDVRVSKVGSLAAERACVLSDCLTWRLSGPAAAAASPPSGCGWCATPGRTSSSVDCRPGRALGQILWHRRRWRRKKERKDLHQVSNGLKK